MKILEKIFGSLSKVKILKLFIFNPETFFTDKIISSKAKVRLSQTRKDMNLLVNMGLVKRRQIKNDQGKKEKGWVLDDSFVYLEALRDFLLKVSPFTNEEIIRRLSKSGKLKFVVISGVFIDDLDARVDILIVGEKQKKEMLQRTLRMIEAELGKEIRYSILDTEDFNYRMSIGDKLIRDIFDYPHKIVFNKIGYSE